MGRIGEYAQEEGGILELDGELLEAGKVSGKYWMFLLYSCILSRASTSDHCQRVILCTEQLWIVFCFCVVTFYGLCERARICPYVVSWQKRTEKCQAKKYVNSLAGKA